MRDKPSIPILAECVANHPYQDNQNSANGGNVSQDAGDALRTCSCIIVDKTQRDDDSAQEGQQHLVHSPDKPLIPLAAAQVHKYYQNYQDGTGDNNNHAG